MQRILPPLLLFLSLLSATCASAGARQPIASEFGSLDWLLDTWLARGDSAYVPPPLDPRDRFRGQLAPQGTLRAGQAERAYATALPFASPALDDAALRWRVRSDLQFVLAEPFYVEQRTLVDSQPQLDPASRTKQYRQIDASVETPRAFVGYRAGAVHVRLGRLDECWGPGWTGSLLLNPTAAPADGLWADVTGRRWRARSRFGRIDSQELDGRDRSRWLAAHRFEWQAHPRWRLAWSEAALVASDNGMPLWLANPVLPWALAQQEARGDGEAANVLWTLDSELRLGERWRMYGQFLLDDFMLDAADRRSHPDQLAFLVGCLWTLERPGAATWIASLEATRVGDWVYVHHDPLVRLRAWDGLLGHPAGPGSEAVTLAIARETGVRRDTVLLWVRWHRRGRVWIGTDDSPVGAAGDPFPAPPRARFLQAGGLWRQALPAGWRVTWAAGWNDLARDAGDFAPADPMLRDPARGGWISLALELPVLRLAGG